MKGVCFYAFDAAPVCRSSQNVLVTRLNDTGPWRHGPAYLHISCVSFLSLDLGSAIALRSIHCIGKSGSKQLKVLMSPYYYKRHNVDTGNSLPYCQQPIFSFRDGIFASAYLRVLIDRAYADNDVTPMTDLQLEALDYIDDVAARSDMHVEFKQEPGDIVLLNNWVTYHRRTQFTDHEDLTKRRHLLRIWLAVPNSRALDEMFRENYGAVEAGAIRGGMQAN